MGGLYGNAAATALEDCPEAARGLISGMLQQGYAFGYLLATVFSRGLVGTTSHGWRPLFWFGACPPVLIIIFRLCLPETKSYLERAAVRSAKGNVAGTFVAEGRVALKKHWLLLLYLVLLMAGFIFMVHWHPMSRRPQSADVGLVAWFSGLVSNDVEEPIQFLAKCCHSNPSSGESWCHDWRNRRRIL